MAGTSITRSDLDKYLTYAERYYAQSAPQSCAVRGCGNMRQQILARLIEERVVLAFASRHHVSLSASDRMQIGAQVAHLEASHAGPGWPHAAIPFIRGILTRQALIQEVVRAVTPQRLLRGPSVHLIVYQLPAGDDRAYKQALTLATNGSPIPAGARLSDEWVAASHVPADIRTAAAAASAGQYFGPFSRHDQLLVYRLLARRIHRYSAPARARVEAAYFAHWLRLAVAREHPRCYKAAGESVPCPAAR